MQDEVGESQVVGRVIGTEDATPLEFWVGVAEGAFIQLDDVVALERTLPGRPPVQLYGVVSQVRARHEGARFDSDVFLIEDGLLPAETSEAAQVLATRFEPEVFVPPLPGSVVRRAAGQERDRALFFDGMDKRLPAGLSREDEPLYINLEFVDGTRGAHVNISGISGVATKTSYATFLLHSLFSSGVIKEAINTKALIFNVKGEDLLFLDHANTALADAERDRYAKLGLPAGPFASVAFFAPPRLGDRSATPDVSSRYEGVTSFFWTIAEFCRDELLRFLFADAEDDRQQYTIVIANVEARLKDAVPTGDGAVVIDGVEVRTFGQLIDVISAKVEDEDERMTWAGRSIGQGTVNAFVRRLHAARRHLERLVRADVAHPDRHRIDTDGQQVTVVDLHNLNDRAKRFVVGVTLRRAFDAKERAGTSRPLLFLVLDELNKYAPRDGSSPIKEILLDVAERGRSLGIILLGAQQTASEVERRIIANSSIRVVGRLDAAESGRDEYGFLPAVQRQRSTILKPGTMILSQPELPIPLVVQFPFPAWATRPSEADVLQRPVVDVTVGAGQGSADPFEGLP
jgi:DNA helicase HerA-like ATPase